MQIFFINDMKVLVIMPEVHNEAELCHGLFQIVANMYQHSFGRLYECRSEDG